MTRFRYLVALLALASVTLFLGWKIGYMRASVDALCIQTGVNTILRNQVYQGKIAEAVSGIEFTLLAFSNSLQRESRILLSPAVRQQMDYAQQAIGETFRQSPVKEVPTGKADSAQEGAASKPAQ